MSYDEIVDVVSANDEVLRQEKRSIVYEQKLLFRGINGFICNADKKLWIPRRHPTKKLFPSSLDASVGGHVMAGESYQEAFLRETQEELGVDLRADQYVPLAYLTPHEHGTSAFMWVYMLLINEAPDYNRDDFTEFYWLSVDEVLEKIRQGEPSKSDLLPILQILKNKF